MFKYPSFVLRLEVSLHHPSAVMQPAAMGSSSSSDPEFDPLHIYRRIFLIRFSIVRLPLSPLAASLSAMNFFFERLTSYAQGRSERYMASGEQSRNIRMVPSDPTFDELTCPADFSKIPQSLAAEAMKVRFPIPQVLPCANVETEKYKTCPKPGTMACSRCRLVSYCSKDCQKQHWAKHKTDCKNDMMFDSWKPVWEREGRHPSFVVDHRVEAWCRDELEFSAGMSLWGNTPAMDVINLDLNEKDGKKDFALAFIASGDLRHVLKTVNGLPMTYSGELSILVNDINPLISCRNIVLLLILGTVDDESLAVDMAIHFWYSIFMPSPYKLRLSALIADYLMKVRAGGKTSVPLGPKSKLSTCLPERPSEDLFERMMVTSLSIDDVQQEYERVRSAFCRRDFRDRMYLGLRFSHRVAFEEYRRFGLVLPFGALNAHFNIPNRSLFSRDGQWLQTDHADPLEGWDMAAIIAAGKTCGAQPEDIYGCLYFFLSQELRRFYRRIRAFKISFTVSAFEAGDVLPMVIRNGKLSNHGVPASTRFDRISVSNILDEEYVGMGQVLMGWSHFLAEGPHATIVGYFMNWFLHQHSGRLESAGEGAMRAAVRKLTKMTGEEGILPKSSQRTMNTLKNVIAELGDVEAFYDSSVPFQDYLKKRGLDDVLRKSKLKLRGKHTIVAHRILAPLQGKPSDLPVFRDNDSWYYNTKLTALTWSERYVEFARVLV